MSLKDILYIFKLKLGRLEMYEGNQPKNKSFFASYKASDQ